MQRDLGSRFLRCLCMHQSMCIEVRGWPAGVGSPAPKDCTQVSGLAASVFVHRTILSAMFVCLCV